MRRHAKAATAGSTQHKAAVALAVLLTLSAALFCAAPAFAGTASDRPLIFSFDGSDTTAGAFAGIQRLGIDQATGAVYVMDTGHDVIDKFDSSGVATNFSATGTSSLSGSGTPQASFGLNGDGDVSVDNSGGATQGQIYVNRENGPIDAFSSSGGYLWQLGAELFNDDCGTAVDAAGHLWVGNFSSQKALEYDNTGSPPAQIGSVTSTTGSPCRLNLDASGNIFFNIWNNKVDKYVGGAFSSTLDATTSQDVAIDQSSAIGHLFTIHSGDFNEYESSGTLVGTFGTGLLTTGRGIAYNKALDRVYVSDASSKTVKVFGPAVTGTVPDVTIEASSEVGVSKAKFNGKINPQSVPDSYLFEWKVGTGASWAGAKSTAPQSIEPTDSAEHAVSFNATGLAGNTTFQVRLVGKNTENGLRAVSSSDTFTTIAATAPAVTIAAPSAITGATATVSGTVNPEQDFGATWRLQLSTDGACASGFSDQPTHNLESEANSPVAVSEELTGLLSNQHYCVRISATNSGGTTNSEVKEFTTDPAAPTQVFTAFAAPRTGTTARLNGRVNPEGANPVHPLTYRFEYSEDSGATWISLPDREYSGGAREQIVLADELTGLSPNTTYSYRFSAEDEAGEASPQGEVKSFPTRTTAEMSLPARGFELVNNPDKGNQRAIAQFADGASALSPDGSRALWTTFGGAPGGSTSNQNTFLAKRTPSGWVSQSLVPPANMQIGDGDQPYLLEEATPDLAHFIFRVSAVSVFGVVSQPVLARIDAGAGEGAFEQTALKAYNDPKYFASGIDLTADGAHVLARDPETEQLQDIGDGTPEPVSIMPEGAPAGCFGGTDNMNWTLRKPGYHAISATDASRVYFSAKPNANCGSQPGLYERNREGDETTLVDPGTSGQQPELIRATVDGLSAYFVTVSQLDPADGNVDPDIYRWDEQAGESTCLTCEANPDANVTGAVLVSDNFTHIYFESRQQLVPGQGKQGDVNLYTMSGGSIRFVADPNQAGTRVLFAHPRLSSDGNVLLFEALASPRMTADALATQCVIGQEASEPLTACTELYRYDDRDRSVECISCRQGGVTDHNIGTAASISNRSYQLSGDGRTVAFATRQALGPLDVNHDTDIYEWRNDALRLITDGVTDQLTGFSAPQVLGLDQDGADLLFGEVPPGGSLTGFEQDAQLSLYDARVGGGFSPPNPPVHCSEDSCQGPLQAAPEPGAATSSGFRGRGNQAPHARRRRPCARKRRAAKRRCIHRHKGHSKKRSAQHNTRRAK